jgi:hypothetical protein
MHQTGLNTGVVYLAAVMIDEIDGKITSISVKRRNGLEFEIDGPEMDQKTKSPVLGQGILLESSVGREGFEPSTNGLKVRCSTD